MKKIRVLVAEDCTTVRKYIVDNLNRDEELQVVGEAVDARRAVDLCGRLRPDVVTMDMALAFSSGLEATEQIMAHFPTPILIVSAAENRGELYKTCDALAAGAVDVLEKPTSELADGLWNEELVSKVRLLSRIRVITHLRGKRSSFAGARQCHHRFASKERAATPEVVAIGTSSGGPAAVLEILRGLAPDFPLPILLVLHLGASFGTAFANWLDGQVRIPVRQARHGARLAGDEGPAVLVAPPDRHLRVHERRLRLDDGPERHSCRPSVDVLFESLACEMGPGVIACLLTGMGRDGARGLAEIRHAGGVTLAQDEATSVVFGMPREAIRLGGAGKVLPLFRFAETLTTLAGACKTGGAPP